MKITVNGKEKNIKLDNEKALLSSTLESLGYSANTIVVEVGAIISGPMKPIDKDPVLLIENK